uniref:Uncharacterized protein n=1 Tax=Solanum lycopersicum TaxID=4081 RepID=K4CT51_SOLLC
MRLKFKRSDIRITEFDRSRDCFVADSKWSFLELFYNLLVVPRRHAGVAVPLQLLSVGAVVWCCRMELLELLFVVVGWSCCRRVAGLAAVRKLGGRLVAAGFFSAAGFVLLTVGWRGRERKGATGKRRRGGGWRWGFWDNRRKWRLWVVLMVVWVGEEMGEGRPVREMREEGGCGSPFFLKIFPFPLFDLLNNLNKNTKWAQMTGLAFRSKITNY